LIKYSLEEEGDSESIKIKSGGNLKDKIVEWFKSLMP
jgi:hypothetical protein